MSKHSHIKKQLYDYLQHEISPQERIKIEKHIASCKACAEEAENLKSVIEITKTVACDYSDERSPSYWNNFAQEIDRKLPSDTRPKRADSLSLWDTFNLFLLTRKRLVIAYGTVVTILVCVVAVWQWHSIPTAEKTVTPPFSQSDEYSKTDERIAQYLRKSKILLVGITNMDIREDRPFDLSTEKKISRALVHEGRYLQQQPLDIRSAQLVNELEKVLIELANIKEKNDVPSVEIIRNGIHRENLLFKIRMTEPTYQLPQVK